MIHNSSRVVLLTGASGGLGRILSNHLAGEGFRLALSYHSGTLIPHTDNEHIRSYKADIRSEEEVQQMIQQIVSDFGRIDILINNAGISRNGVTWKLDTSDWNDSIAVNLNGTFHMLKHTLPVMRNNEWGRIVNMSSVVASNGMPGTIAYAASKAALHGIARTVALETASKNITINNIALGYMDAGMLYEIPEEIRNDIREKIPMKKFGPPNEICALVDYLISDNASYLTGQTLHLNGGV
jgi:NAD(P)-dependent dehydrogenase (short-subunit alcohol dehydrogenase family)